MYRKCLYDGKALAYVENVWDFKNEKENEKTFEISFENAVTLNKDKMEAVVEKYSCNDVEYAFRIYVTIGNINFMVDRVKATLPICVYSNFCFENANHTLSINVADKSKLVVRNGGGAFKFFRLLNVMDGNDMLPTGGLSFAESAASNGVDMKMSYYTGLHKVGLDHTAVFCLCTGDSVNVRGWHMRTLEDGGLLVEPRDKVASYVLYVNEDVITVKSLETGEVLEIDLKQYM
ncbi:MAG: hypothetical protein IJ332_04600 [Clostridia bacterium]|nr:hypothetical protein [Clostridia bacterium]